MPLESLLTATTTVVGLCAAFLIGVSKTGVPGVGLFACLLMISAFSGREMFASGAVVPLLILGDVAAVWFTVKTAISSCYADFLDRSASVCSAARRSCALWTTRNLS